MRQLFILFFFCFTFSFLNAQTVSDALRYSNLDYGTSTARTMGVGGGLGALGADYSVISTNPAGLALYRKSELVFTPALFSTTIDSELAGSTANESTAERENKFRFTNIGAVFQTVPNRVKIKTFNVAIGFNRLANYNRTFTYEGASLGSITNRWLEQANSLNGLSSFESGLASEVLAIYEDNGFFISDFDGVPSVLVQKGQTVQQQGSMNEMVIGIATNYDEKLMFGFTLGIPFLSYTEEKVYFETDLNDNIDDIPFFNELSYTERLTTTGIGINAKLGLIYRISQALRLGAAVHTPTSYGLNDIFSTTLSYDYTDSQNDGATEASSPEGNFDYRFISPWRFIGSGALIIGRLGFITGEVEWVNYGGSFFNLTTTSDSPDDQAYEIELNESIDSDLQSAIGVKVGAEFALDIMRFRGGYGLQTSPTRDKKEFLNNVSLGFGIRQKSFYIDLAYRFSQRPEVYSPYLTSIAPSQTVSNNSKRSRYLLTFGYRF